MQSRARIDPKISLDDMIRTLKEVPCATAEQRVVLDQIMIKLEVEKEINNISFNWKSGYGDNG